MRQGQAFSHISRQATDKFWNVDRIMFGLSPYITDEESWKIVDEMEKMAKSRHEGNFTPGDALNWVAHMLGSDRWQAVTTMWTIDNQNAIAKLYAPEQLRDAWMHRITMTEATPEELARNPDNYILIKTLKDDYK